jgi:hypothetical protein
MLTVQQALTIKFTTTEAEPRQTEGLRTRTTRTLYPNRVCSCGSCGSCGPWDLLERFGGGVWGKAQSGAGANRSNEGEYMNTDFVDINGCQSALFNVRGKLDKGLHNIFPFNIGIIGQQFFDSLSRADLGNYSSDGNPCSPDTGFTPHNGGIKADTIKMSIVHDSSSIFHKAEQGNALKHEA